MKEKFPAWVNDSEVGKYDLVLSDDIDSLFSCIMLNQVKGYEINYFYDFNQIYVPVIKQSKPRIGVDLALMDMPVWDNHVTLLTKEAKKNVNSANLNTVAEVSRTNYTRKYAGSTLLQIMSFYDIPLPTSREALLVLLAIDSSYLGHYKSFYKRANNDWFRIMGMESLIGFMDTVTIEDYQEVVRKYKLKAKIRFIDGKLDTDIDLVGLSRLFGIEIVLPDVELKVNQKSRLQRGFYNIAERGIPTNMPKSLFSLAFTSTNRFQYTLK